MTQQPITLRCSRLPLAFKCAECVRPGDPSINVGSDIATMGTAVHAALAHHVKHGDAPDLSEIAGEYSISDKVGELEDLFWRGVSLWKRVSEYFPEPKVEVRLTALIVDGWELTGTADLISQPALHRSGVVDWKSGYNVGEYANQVRGYAWLQWAAMGFDPDGEVTVMLIYPRLGFFLTYTYSADDLRMWGKRLVTEIVHRLGTFQPGPHCTYCPRFHTCPGRTELVHSITRDLAVKASVTPASLRQLDPADLVEIRAKVKFIKNLVAQLEDAVRMEVESGGPLPTTDGNALQLQPIPHPTIEAKAAWPVMEQFLSADEINGCLSVRKKALLDEIGKKQPKGQKGKVKKAVMDLLEKAGAVETTVSYRVVEKPLVTEEDESNEGV